MVLYVLFGVLAAYGLLCALWAVFGLWLSAARGWAAVCFDPAALRRCQWLCSWGILRGPVLVVDAGLTQQEKQALGRVYPGIEFCGLEELPARLEQERKNFAGTGERDHPGNHRRGGISEL